MPIPLFLREDEEGDSILDDREDEDFRADRGTTNVTKEEADRLRDAAGYTTDEEGRRIRATALDSTDDDGDPLNEKGFSNAPQRARSRRAGQ